jgi:5-methylcytosine-specific restriction endonuclease McrA
MCRHILRDTWERDHILPIALGGTNDEWNVQILCPNCHRSKTNHIDRPMWIKDNPLRIKDSPTCNV